MNIDNQKWQYEHHNSINFDVSFEDMGRCFRTVSFRQEPENITESQEGAEQTERFDIIADSNNNESESKKPICVSNTFKWNNIQKHQLYSSITKQRSNGEFGGNESLAFNSGQFDPNVHSGVVPCHQSTYSMNVNSCPNIPELEVSRK